jgi:hypothetical protein
MCKIYILFDMIFMRLVITDGVHRERLYVKNFVLVVFREEIGIQNGLGMLRSTL